MDTPAVPHNTLNRMSKLATSKASMTHPAPPNLKVCIPAWASFGAHNCGRHADEKTDRTTFLKTCNSCKTTVTAPHSHPLPCGHALCRPCLERTVLGRVVPWTAQNHHRIQRHLARRQRHADPAAATAADDDKGDEELALALGCAGLACCGQDMLLTRHLACMGPTAAKMLFVTYWSVRSPPDRRWRCGWADCGAWIPDFFGADAQAPGGGGSPGPALVLHCVLCSRNSIRSLPATPQQQQQQQQQQQVVRREPVRSADMSPVSRGSAHSSRVSPVSSRPGSARSSRVSPLSETALGQLDSQGLADMPEGEGVEEIKFLSSMSLFPPGSGCAVGRSVSTRVIVNGDYDSDSDSDSDEEESEDEGGMQTSETRPLPQPALVPARSLRKEKDGGVPVSLRVATIAIKESPRPVEEVPCVPSKVGESELLSFVQIKNLRQALDAGTRDDQLWMK